MQGISATSAASTFVNQRQPETDNAFVNAFRCACNTTDRLQTFYGPEFNRAATTLKHGPHQAAENSEPELDTVFGNLDTFLDELKQTGGKGLTFRLWRDGISLATSVALLATMVSALTSQEERNAGDFSAANNPVGSPAADWSLVLLEWGKALVTTSLSYPTLKRHHLVDEFVKRMTASTALLSACLEDQAATLPVKHASQWATVKRNALQCAEKGRDVSTPFTLLNAMLSLARGLLSSTEMMGGGTTPASWRGLLRLVQSGSDSLRSIFSTIGTVSRNKLFGIDLDQLRTALPALREQLRNCDPEQVLPQLQKMKLLFSVCSTPLLSCIAESNELLTDFKNTDIASSHALRDFLESRQIPVASNGEFLHSEAPENHWGERLVEGTYTGTPGMAVRAPYRLTLETQHQMSRPSEGMDAWQSARRNTADAAPESVVVQRHGIE